MMKTKILFLMTFLLIFAGLAIGQTTKEPEELIIGKWVDNKGLGYTFTKDEVVYINDEEFGTYRLLENTLEITKKGEDHQTFYYKYEFAGDDILKLRDNYGEGTVRIYKRVN